MTIQNIFRQLNNFSLLIVVTLSPFQIAYSHENKSVNNFLTSELRNEHHLNDEHLAQLARERNEPPFQISSPRLGAKARVRESLDQVGQWGEVKTWPFVFASAANLPDGRIVAWGGNHRTTFNGGQFTYTGVWDPSTNQITEHGYDQHSMFCAIPTMRENGQVFVVGGDGATRNRTSLFDYRTNSWSLSNAANTGRWYNGSLQLPNGKVFLALGSDGSRYPELWTEGKGWHWLNGIDLQAPILSYKSEYSRPDWFPQMTLAPNGEILHIGPTPKMHYINPTGNGSIRGTGVGITNWHAQNQAGTSIMFDKGKVITLGGIKAKNRATIVDMNGVTPQITPITNMNQPRAHANATVLPTGEVFVVGGTSEDVWFSDRGSILTPEIWNPQTRKWRKVDNHAVPRNYHSVALLMTDGRIFSGGGGLCNCAADHPNHQVYSPPYLFNTDGSLAKRPVISDAPDTVKVGQSIDILASSGIKKFTLVKMSGTTHSHNTDLRFLNVSFDETNGKYQLKLEGNRNVMTPGYWMLFAINDRGTPSVAKVIQVRNIIPIASTPGPYRYVKLVAESEVNGNPWSSAAEIKIIDGNGNEIDRNAWTAISNSQAIDGIPMFAIDGKIQTIWHTQWRDAQPTHPHEFIIDMGVGYNLNGFRYLPRQQGSINGTIARYKFHVSSDGVNWSLPVAQGTFVNNRAEKTVLFSDITPKFNLARDKTTAQSSVYHGGIPNRLIDGNTDGRWTNGSVNHTTVENKAWWEIDLGQRFNLTDLRIWNRSDCCADRLSNFHVFVSDIPFVSKDLDITQNQLGVTDFKHPGTAGRTTDFTLDRTGRFVRVQLAGTGSMNLAEIEVMGGLVPVPIPPTIAPVIPKDPSPISAEIEYKVSAIGGNGLRYKWIFGDGTAETNWSSSPKITHRYTSPGRYEIKVIVSNSSGQETEQYFYQAIHNPVSNEKPAVSMSVIYEENSTNNRIWNVNPDNNTVSIIDSTTNLKINEIAVGQKPQSLAIAPDGRVWVTNKKSSTISIIDGDSQTVVQTIDLPIGSQPFGITFAPNGSAVYITLEASGKLIKLNPMTGIQIDSIDIGMNIRELSIDANSNKIYVSRFITQPVSNESSATPNVSEGAGEVFVINADLMNISRKIILNHSNTPDVDSGGRGIPNYLGPAVIAPDGLSAWVPSKQDNIARGTLRDGRNLNHENTVRSIGSYINISTSQEELGKRIDFDNGGIANTALFDRYGNYLFVVLEGSREIAVVDAYANNELFRINVGHAPQGLAISADNKTLYIHNFMDRSISVHDVGNLTKHGEKTSKHVTNISTVTNEQLSTQVLRGKKLFYDSKDTRLARDSYMSCASCHNDGGHDGRIWDVTGFGEGLRNTITLNGRSGVDQGLLHWGATFDEVQDFEGQIRNLSGGTGLMNDRDFFSGTRSEPLGEPKKGISPDLDALAAYVSSLTKFSDSPFRQSNGSLTSQGVAGKVIFEREGCSECHSGNSFTDSETNVLHDIGTLMPGSGTRLGQGLSGIDTPTLRGIWNTAPYLHNGSAQTLEDAVNAHNNVDISPTEMSVLVSFLQQIDGKEPAINPTLSEPPLCETGVDPQIIQAGEGTALWWWSQNVNSATIDHNIGSVTLPSNYEWLTPSETTTYKMVATGQGGSTTCEATVVVNGALPTNPPLCTIGADPQAINLGEGTALWWWTDNVTIANMNNGIGAVELPSNYTWFYPVQTETYILDVRNPNGEASRCETTITVQ